MLFKVILLCSIVIVTATQISYRNESFTLTEVPCMTDCINNVCILGSSKKTEECNPGRIPGLQYYTARDRTQNKLCRSRCGKFDNSTDDWCYVSDDEWDYCNPEMGTDIVKHKTFTSSKGPCKDECQHRRTIHNNKNIWCYTHWGGWDYCDLEGFTYMQTKTRQGLNCVGICGAHDNKDYNWCVSTDEIPARCALIARNFSIYYRMFDQLSVLKKKDGCHIKDDQLSYKHDSVPSGFVSRHAKLLEYPNIGVLTENVNEVGNSISRHTIMPYATEGDPAIPLVVRARVIPETLTLVDSSQGTSFPIRVRENIQRMGANVEDREYKNEEDGHIISSILGGSGQVYNFAAPTQRRLLPAWYNTEVLIRDFIVRTNGWAEIAVVIVYSNISESWIPDGYAVDFALYNFDNTLYRECNDYYYSNHPDYSTN